MSTQPAAAPVRQLSNGNAIEYKAFVRKFFAVGEGTLFVIASCYYITSGFTIFFEENQPGDLSLMETPPTGIVLDLVTYYVASWTSNVDADHVPTHLTITDAHGAHRVHVTPWT
jgi:hypothetical protein